MSIEHRGSRIFVNLLQRIKKKISWRQTVPLLCFSVGILADVANAEAISDAHLWLPGRYKQYLPNLNRAAVLIDEGERCEKVIRGELLESKSTLERPVFRIICRDSQQMTFVSLVDGISYIELQASGETRLQQNQRHLPNYARICLNELKQKTATMINTRFPEGSGLQPSVIDEELIEFEVDFSAEAIEGAVLEYRGYCHFESLRDYSVVLKPRPSGGNK